MVRMYVEYLHYECNVCECVLREMPYCCRHCDQEEAFEESQKYKEGKFIIEKAKMSKGENW